MIPGVFFVESRLMGAGALWVGLLPAHRGLDVALAAWLAAAEAPGRIAAGNALARFRLILLPFFLPRDLFHCGSF